MLLIISSDLSILYLYIDLIFIENFFVKKNKFVFKNMNYCYFEADFN
jgi:hypothetical protein